MHTADAQSLCLSLKWAGIKKIIFSTPLFGDDCEQENTHIFCNHQALQILANDGYEGPTSQLKKYLIQLDKGVQWADRGKGSINHHYNPSSGKGLWHWASAAATCAFFYSKAFGLWERGFFEQAMFFLGASTHLIQDVCAPHHARCQVLDGHQRFERWVSNRVHSFRVFRNGIYQLKRPPEEWISINATEGYQGYSLVRLGNSSKDYHQAASHLLALAQRSTAGFWLSFLEKARII
ncbi:MAG: zinc dependent phospholipase C family protein [Bacillota bacterium]